MRDDAAQPFRVIRGLAHEHADAPHPLTLLRPGRERPRAAAPPSSVMNARRSSFDHLVGAGEEGLRHGEAERLRGLDD